jgi:hypothetical protein
LRWALLSFINQNRRLLCVLTTPIPPQRLFEDNGNQGDILVVNEIKAAEAFKKGASPKG